MDLLWNFDALRRLSDATAGAHRKELPPTNEYVEPGPLWWAFDPLGLHYRVEKEHPGSRYPGRQDKWRDAVLLIDEIDKADPDVPNDLLEPFGTKSFIVRETGEQVSAKRDVLLILTTNGERELPPAFLPRCYRPCDRTSLNHGSSRSPDKSLVMTAKVYTRVLRRKSWTFGERRRKTAIGPQALPSS